MKLYMKSARWIMTGFRQWRSNRYPRQIKFLIDILVRMAAISNAKMPKSVLIEFKTSYVSNWR